jgi:hypothetical protein
MKFRIYIIDDSSQKLSYFPPLLESMNTIDIHEYIDGFDGQYQVASTNYRLIREKIEHSSKYPDENIWLLDMKLEKEENRIVAKQLIDNYYNGSNKAIVRKYSNDPTNPMLLDDSYALSLILMSILDDKKIPFYSVSTVATKNADRFFKKAYPHLSDIDYPDRLIDTQIKSTAKQLIVYIANSFQHPIKSFLGSLKGNNCHAAEQNDYTCFAHLAQLLRYENEIALLEDFEILDRKHNYQSPNVLEEALKCFSARGKEGLSLASVMLIAWAVYRRSQNDDERQELSLDDSFKQNLLQINHALQHEDSRQKSYGAGLARYYSIIPNQSASTYEKTLTALYNMVRNLIINVHTKEFSLLRTKLEDNEWTLYFKIGINGELVETLNGLHKNLIDVLSKGNFNKNHLTSNQILKFWLYSAYCDVESDIRDEPLLSSSHWGSVARFKIETIDGVSTNLKFLAI